MLKIVIIFLTFFPIITFINLFRAKMCNQTHVFPVMLSLCSSHSLFFLHASIRDYCAFVNAEIVFHLTNRVNPHVLIFWQI